MDVFSCGGANGHNLGQTNANEEELPRFPLTQRLLVLASPARSQDVSPDHTAQVEYTAGLGRYAGGFTAEGKE